MDTLTKSARSKRMSRIRNRDTGPELVARRLIDSLGIAYVSSDKSLPGTPDLSFPALKKVIWVHGCFWHQHGRCGSRRFPKTRRTYWKNKLSANVARDIRNQRRLNRMGWHYRIIWECELGKNSTIFNRVARFLGVYTD